MQIGTPLIDGSLSGSLSVWGLELLAVPDRSAALGRGLSGSLSVWGLEPLVTGHRTASFRRLSGSLSVWGLEVGGFLDFSFGDSASVVYCVWGLERE